MAGPRAITPQERNADLRRPLYEDVEALLCPGFLSHSYQIGSTEFCLRSASPGDMLLLKARIGRNPTVRTWMEWTVASCTWMVDGQPLLEDHRAALRIRNALRTLKAGALKSLFAIFQGLHVRVGTALQRVESYCYENYSRGFWRMCERQNPGRDEFTGIPGTSRLGVNHAQRLWMAYNLAEDDRLDDMADWSAAKLVASAHSPKGVKQLNAADQRRHRSEEQRRQQVQNRMYWEAMGDAEQADRMTVKRSVTPTELIDEMRKWVAGEKDDHDIIVETQKKKIQDRFEAERRDRERRRKMLEAQQELGQAGGGDLVGYTLDDLAKLTRDRPPGQKPTVRKVFEGGDPRRLYQKYLAEEPSSGRLAAGEYGVVTRETQKLDTQLQDRQVRLRRKRGDG